MIKALPTMELFQVIKRYIKQSGLNFQKCYERDQNKRAGGREPHNRSGSRGLDKSISIFSFYFLNYFFQYSKTIFKFCCLSFLLKRITQKHTQVCKFLVVAKTKQCCLINSKEIFIILI